MDKKSVKQHKESLSKHASKKKSADTNHQILIVFFAVFDAATFCKKSSQIPVRRFIFGFLMGFGILAFWISVFFGTNINMHLRPSALIPYFVTVGCRVRILDGVGLRVYNELRTLLH